MGSKKWNWIFRLQAWMDSKTGQQFLNYAYSWGASIVILGALFKLTHIAGANMMLFIGMGTEVIVFFLAGFEHQYANEGDITDAEDKRLAVAAKAIDDSEEAEERGTVVVGGGGLGGGTIIIGGNGGGAPAGGGTVVIGGGGVPASGAAGTEGSVASSTGDAPVDAAALAEGLSHISVPQYSGMTPEMHEATEAYVNQLHELTEVLKQVAEQSARLTRDSEEMENMNRTLTGINRFYEMQLRDVGQQSATLDDVNAQTKRLAEQLVELNGLYTRMVEALKANLKG
jgi:hypothetical protein